MPYANLENLLADYLPEVKKDVEKDAVERMLNGVTAYVDKYCKRASGYFDPSPNTALMKRVRGESEQFLRLPVHIFGSIESVTLNGTVIDSATYYESDKNGWLYLEDNPYFSENSFNDYFGMRWYDGFVYKVTAKWGYLETPADIQQAVCQIVQRWFRTVNGIIGEQMPNGFILERDMPKSAKAILDTYIRRPFEI